MFIRLSHSTFVIICLVILNGQGIYSQTRTRSRSSANDQTSVQSDSKPAAVTAFKGETLRAIAARVGQPVEELERLNRISAQARLRKGQRILLPAPASSNPVETRQAIGYRISFADGDVMDVDEAWRQGSIVWYRRGGVGQSLERDVRAIDPIFAPTARPEKSLQPVLAAAAESTRETSPSVWVYLVGGARFKVDDVKENSDGAWYNRGNLSVFLEKARIARIERLEPGSPSRGRRDVDWTSGNARIDELIRTNGARYGVDPYLVFCVIEHESHFRSRALSPKGAQGLMQLMPGTARRFGVRRPYDVAENIKGGTQYLKELMAMFDGRVNLVLASYNAGEGAVLKYGRSVPPYKETREYVKRIGKRYGINGRESNPDNDIPPPRQ